MTDKATDKAAAKDAPKAAAREAGKAIHSLGKTEKETMTQTKKKFEKLHQDATAAGKENFQAFVESGNILARGAESYFKAYAAWAQTAAERNTQAFKSLLSCKTLNEFTEVQNVVAQQNLDDFLSGMADLSELAVKVTTEALEPINDQFGKTVRKAQNAAAA